MSKKSQHTPLETPAQVKRERAKEAGNGPEWSYYVVPTVCWLYFSYIALTLLPPPLSPWFVIPCALLLGFIATVVFAAFLIVCGGHTLLEMEVNMAICLVLLFLLLPVFARAREKARYQAAIAHQNAIQAAAETRAKPVTSPHP